MRDGRGRSSADPQIAHNLSCKPFVKTVNNLWMDCMLLGSNEAFAAAGHLYARGFLPTMKLQLSQLP